MNKSTRESILIRAVRRSVLILLSLCAFTPSVFAGPILRMEEESFLVKVGDVHDGNQYELSLKFFDPDVDLKQVNAFAVPSHLVVDFPEMAASDIEQRSVEHVLVEAIRYGVRKGRMRMILDLRNNLSPQLAVRYREPSEVIIAFRVDGKEVVDPDPKEKTTKVPAAGKLKKGADNLFSVASSGEIVRSEQEQINKDLKENKGQGLVFKDDNATERKRLADLVEANKERHLQIMGAIDQLGRNDEPISIFANQEIMMWILGASGFLSALGFFSLGFGRYRKNFGTDGDTQEDSGIINIRKIRRRRGGKTDELLISMYGEPIVEDDSSIYYDLLNVKPTDSNTLIKKRYRELVKQFHSDKAMHQVSSSRGRQMADERFMQVKEAYQQICRIRHL